MAATARLHYRADIATPSGGDTAGTATIVLPVEVKAIPGFEDFSDTFNEDAGGPIDRRITSGHRALSRPSRSRARDDPRTALQITFDNFADLEPFRGIGALDVFSVLRQAKACSTSSRSCSRGGRN